MTDIHCFINVPDTIKYDEFVMLMKVNKKIIE